MIPGQRETFRPRSSSCSHQVSVSTLMDLLGQAATWHAGFRADFHLHTKRPPGQASLFGQPTGAQGNAP